MATMIIHSLTGWIPTYVIEPIIQKIRVLRKDKENMEELEKQTANLGARRTDRQAHVEEEKMLQGVGTSDEAEIWFNNVNKAVSDSSDLQTEFNKQQRRGRFPSCFFCCSRYQMSKKALKLKKDVDELYEKEPRCWTRPILQRGRHLDTISIEGQKRTEKLKQEIIESVLGDRYSVVGLHGMGGIGKTTLLRHANEHFRNTEHFESVIFVTVSATPDFVDIRKQIAQSLRLSPDDMKDDDNLKQKLSYLIERKKYLLILDDMWDEPIIDLREICNIPAPRTESGCKILMASRSESVITRFVTRFATRDSLHLIQVNKLPDDEAWDLFVEKVGAHIASKPEIEPLAKEVVRKCDGLPLAILVIGGTMSTRETEAGWKNAVRELRQPSSTSNIEGVQKEVFPMLLFSFKQLDPIEQSLFLYCCLFPEDYSIEKSRFYDFAIGEETLFDIMQLNLEDMRNKVDDFLGKLRTLSMLERNNFHAVKMHDVMRDLGVWITSPTTTLSYYHSKYIAKPRARITEAPDAPEWCNATKISLMFTEIKSLPQLRDQCLQLHTLLLRGCSRIEEIPQVRFLEHMPALHVLDLSSTQIEFLPPSISHLVNLRLLRLCECYNIKELPSEIGKLDQLISLDLFNCMSLIKLPVEMKKLHNLRCLDISFTEKLKKIPQGVLSGLHKLVELDTMDSGLTLNTDYIRELSQVIHCLTSVCISKAEIKNVKVSQWLKPILSTEIYDLHLCDCVIDPSALPDLLLEDFPYNMKFTSCEGLTHVPTRGCISLTVQGCPDLKNLLIDEEESKSHIAFEKLKFLELDQLDQLETICNGVPQQPRCFSNLSKITIKGCPNLKVLFTNGVIQLLKELRSLHVYQCPHLVYLIVSNDVEELEIISALPSLEVMSLCELPELIAICNNHYHSDLMKWPSLSTTHVYHCPKLTTPPSKVQPAAVSFDKMTLNFQRVAASFDEEMLLSRSRLLQRHSILSAPLEFQHAAVSFDAMARNFKTAAASFDAMARNFKTAAASFVGVLQYSSSSSGGRSNFQHAAVSLEEDTNDSPMSLNYLGGNMKKVVLKLEIYDHKAKIKAMKVVSTLSGVDSVAMDMEQQKMTVIGEVDPIEVVGKMRKLWHAEVDSVGPA